jgi:hypothetical protein
VEEVNVDNIVAYWSDNKFKFDDGRVSGQYREGREDNDLPSDEIVFLMKENGVKQKLTNKEVLEIANHEVKKSKLKSVRVEIDEDMGDDDKAAYCDGVLLWEYDDDECADKAIIRFHPLVKWTSKAYIKGLTQHELSHQKSEIKKRRFGQ